MSVPSQIGLICQRHLDENLSLLNLSPLGLNDEEVVHELRVSTKRLRAAWKMVAPSVGAALKAERAAALREFSALLAEDRDLAVLVGLCRELEGTYPDASFGELISFLGKDVNENVEPGSDQKIRILIEEEKKAWNLVQFDSPEEEPRSHRRVIRDSLRKARQATLAALANSDAEVWHNWRKKVKSLRYQREFLAEIQGRMPGKWDARISRLGSRLGDRNDLANLTTIVVKLGNSPPLRKAIAMEERGILGNCRRLGRRNLGRN